MMADRSWLDERRWSTVDCFPTREAALESARKHRRADSFGPNRAFRVTKSRSTERWCVEHASPLTGDQRRRGAYYNRKVLETEHGQRKMGL